MFTTQADIYRRALMKRSLCLMLATFLPLTNNVRAADAPPRPEILAMRQEEDWSALRDPALRTDLFDRVKFIPLNRDGSSWLTLGGEARERYEYFENANWAKVRRTTMATSSIASCFTPIRMRARISDSLLNSRAGWKATATAGHARLTAMILMCINFSPTSGWRGRTSDH